jgi:drug/metabolite transporter (DMT)-like permease
MLYLLVVSLIWAFSFGLIKNSLSGIDANLVAAVRLGISLVFFLPLFRPRIVDAGTGLRLALTGAVQYGGMYIAYLYAFRYLQAYQVALFTIFTPLFVTLTNDVLERRLNLRYLAAAVLAVGGTWITQTDRAFEPGILTGFLIVQVSNVCFAVGQVAYRRIMAASVARDENVFAYLYLGGFLAAGLSALTLTDWSSVAVSGNQWLALLYLGAVASGLGFFWWNKGARRVNAGILAVFNDLKIPLAVAVSLAFFGEQTSLPHLLAGGSVLAAALLLAQRGAQPAKVSAATAD